MKNLIFPFIALLGLIVAATLQGCGKSEPSSPTTPLSATQENEFRKETHNIIVMLSALGETANQSNDVFFGVFNHPLQKRRLSTEWLGLNEQSSKEAQAKDIIRKAFEEKKCVRIASKPLESRSRKVENLWDLSDYHGNVLIKAEKDKECPIVSNSKFDLTVDKKARRIAASCDYKVAFLTEELQKVLGIDRFELTCGGNMTVAEPITELSTAALKITGKIHSLEKGDLEFYIEGEGKFAYASQSETKIETAQAQLRFLFSLPGYNAEMKLVTDVTRGVQKNEYFVNSKPISEDEASSYFKVK